MKQRDLLRRLQEIAASKGLEFAFVREGGSHTVYRIGSQRVAIGRHREIPDQTAHRIIRDAEDLS